MCAHAPKIHTLVGVEKDRIDDKEIEVVYDKTERCYEEPEEGYEEKLLSYVSFSLWPVVLISLVTYNIAASSLRRRLQLQ